MNKKIDETLGLNPIDDLEETTDENGMTVYEKAETPAVPETPDKSEKERDMEYARANIIDLISKGTNALDDLENIAIQTQQARAYEVYTNLVKAMVEANKDFVELSEKKNPEEKKEEPKTENHLHLTTSDFLKLMNEAKESKDDG